jgi:hypothetical protein
MGLRASAGRLAAGTATRPPIGPLPSSKSASENTTLSRRSVSSIGGILGGTLGGAA